MSLSQAALLQGVRDKVRLVVTEGISSLVNISEFASQTVHTKLLLIQYTEGHWLFKHNGSKSLE